MKKSKIILSIVFLALVSGLVVRLLRPPAQEGKWEDLYETLATPVKVDFEPIPEYNGKPRKFVQPEPAVVEVPESPSDLQIQRAGWFGNILVPIDIKEVTAEERAEENRALQSFAQAMENGSDSENLEALADWLAKNPDSRWRFALQDIYLGMRFDRGYFTEAGKGWESLWGELKDVATKNGLLLGNRVMGQLLDTHMGIGKTRELRNLVSDMEGRYRDGVLEGKLLRARQSLWLREHTGAQNVMCGPLALNCIADHLGMSFFSPNLNNVKTDYIASGIPLSEVRQYAEKRYELPARLATRDTDSAAIPTPSVVHFKDEHFAAVLAHDPENDRYLLEDRMLEFKDWVDSEALEQSMSGHILLASNEALPGNWSPLSEDSARDVFGRDGAHGIEDPEENVTPDDTTTDDNPENPDFPDSDNPDDPYKPDESDPDAPNSCEGMPRYTFLPFPGSIRISDIPLRYTPPVGPRVALKLNYVDLSGDAADSDVAPVGIGWCTDWVSYVVPGSYNRFTGTTTGDARLHLPGGGIRIYKVDSSTGVFEQSDRDFSTAEAAFDGDSQNQVPATYTIRRADGWTHVYGHRVRRTFAPTLRLFLSEVIDPAGNRLRLVYEDETVVGPEDPTHFPTTGSTRLHAIVDAKENATLIDYGPDDSELWNKIVRVTDPYGRSCTLEYDGLGRLSAVTDMIGLRSSFTYTTEGFPATMTTPYGQTTFSKSGSGLAGTGDADTDGPSERIIEVTDPMGRTERIQFIDKAGGPEVPSIANPLQVVDVGGSQVPFYADNARLNFRNSFYWDKKQYHAGPGNPAFAVNYRFYTDENYQVTGVLEAVKRPLQSRMWFNYPGAGVVNSGNHSYYPGNGRKPEKRLRMLDATTGQLTQTYYNTMGKLSRTVDPIGRSTLINYAANGIDVTSITQTSDGINERLATVTYNSQHLPLTIKDAAGYTSTLTYNARGQITSVRNAKNETTTFEYGPYWNLTSIDGPLPGTQDRHQFEYDSQDRINRLIGPDGYTLSMVRDNFDRVTQISFPDGTSRDLVYDRLHLASLTDRIGLVTSYTYHPDRRIKSVTDPADRTLLYDWCRCGDLRQLTDQMGRVTQWIRDIQGRVTRKQYVDGTGTNYEYHPISGRLQQRTDAKGQHKLYDYTIDGRLAQISYPNAEVETPTIAWSYDPKYARLATMNDGEGLTTYAYHAVTGAVNNGAGKLQSIDGPWQNDVVTYAYDELGRPLSRAIDGVAETVNFDAAGRITTLTNALGQFTHTYDGGTQRLLGLDYPNGQRTNYTYADNAGDRRLINIANLKPGGGKLSAFRTEYDSVGRVIKWHQQNGSANPKIYSLGYDDAGQLTSAIASQGGLVVESSAWGYDDAGNRTNEQVNGVESLFESNELNELTSTSKRIPAAAYSWDAENRMKSMTTDDQRVEFSYNGNGLKSRIVTRKGGSVESDHSLSWQGARPNALRDATGAIIERYYGQGIEKIGLASPGRFYFSRDHLGSVRDVTDTSGVVRQQSSYGIWGERDESPETFHQPFGFTGHYVIDGLVSAPFRDYDPQSSRWLSRDPIGERGGINLYQYVANSPVNHRDRFGFEPSPLPKPTYPKPPPYPHGDEISIEGPGMFDLYGLFGLASLPKNVAKAVSGLFKKKVDDLAKLAADQVAGQVEGALNENNNSSSDDVDDEATDSYNQESERMCRQLPGTDMHN